MARYPKAKYREVSGLSLDPPIIPIGVILHVRSGTGSSLFDYFNGPSGGIESHFYLTYDGKWEQYRDTEREADANYHGNSFVIDGRRYGFISFETEGTDNGTWTDTQLDEIKEFLVWASKTHKIPLRVCPAWNQSGVGYHVLFGAPGAWTPVAKSCPGPNRIKQFNQVLVPWFKNPTTEDDMQEADWVRFENLLDERIEAKVAEAVWATVTTHLGDGTPRTYRSALNSVLRDTAATKAAVDGIEAKQGDVSVNVKWEGPTA